MQQNSGFTLLELSIVLVIIGLIVGGILVGRDLIHAAEMRGVVRQIDQLNTSVNTFHLKYNCLPGDCINASSFGFTSYDVPDGVSANGDGNGIISSSGGFGVLTESWNAMVHINEAQLLSDIDLVGGYENTPAFFTKFSTSDSTGYLQGAWYITYIDTSTDPVGAPGITTKAGSYFWATTIGTGSTITVFTPADAFAIDSKLDDGFPLSGTILASGSEGLAFDAAGDSFPVFNPATDVGTAGQHYCVIGSAPSYQYNVKDISLLDAVPGSTGSRCTVVTKAAF